jgi:hypothetical protein
MSASVYFIFLIGGLALCVRKADPDVGAPLPLLPVRDGVSGEGRLAAP